MPQAHPNGSRTRRQIALASRRGINPVSQSLRNIGVKAADVRTASWFIYSTPSAVALSASGTGTSTIQIQADSVFELKRLTGWVYVTGTVATPITFPPILVNISDTSSGSYLFDTAVPLGTVAYCGAGFGPFNLPEETQRFFAPNASLTVSFTNVDAGNAYTVRFNLQGNKLFA